MIGSLELQPLLHELMDLIVEEGNFQDLATLSGVFGGALGTDKDVVVLKTGRTGAYLMCLEVVPQT